MRLINGMISCVSRCWKNDSMRCRQSGNRRSVFLSGKSIQQSDNNHTAVEVYVSVNSTLKHQHRRSLGFWKFLSLHPICKIVVHLRPGFASYYANPALTLTTVGDPSFATREDRARTRLKASAIPEPCRGYTSGSPKCAGTRRQARLSSPQIWGHSATAQSVGIQSPDEARPWSSRSSIACGKDRAY